MFTKCFCVVAFLCGALALSAQTTPQPTSPPSQNGTARRGNSTPCWQQAGIEKSTMEQRWAIERDTRSQVEAVCSNSSLTPQQKRQQAHEIRQQARQKMEGLVSPEQEKALSACQHERGGNRMGEGGGGRGEEGGCGEWPRKGQRPGTSPNGSGGANNPPPGTSSQN